MIQEIEIANQFIVTKDLLGSGSFGSVMKCRRVNQSQFNFACKMIRQPRLLEQDIQKNIQAELSALQKLNHPGIVKFYAFEKKQKKWYIVIELCDQSLSDFLQKYQRGLPTQLALKAIRQLLDAFHYLYRSRVAHRDLKPANILVNKLSQHDFVLKLSDFGSSKQILNEKTISYGFGTLQFTAPQIHKAEGDQKIQTFKAQIFSLGLVFYQLCFNQLPMQSFQNIMRLIKNQQQILKSLKKKGHAFVDDLIALMVNPNPEKRIGPQQLFQMGKSIAIPHQIPRLIPLPKCFHETVFKYFNQNRVMYQRIGDNLVNKIGSWMIHRRNKSVLYYIAYANTCYQNQEMKLDLAVQFKLMLLKYSVIIMVRLLKQLDKNFSKKFKADEMEKFKKQGDNSKTIQLLRHQKDLLIRLFQEQLKMKSKQVMIDSLVEPSRQIKGKLNLIWQQLSQYDQNWIMNIPIFGRSILLYLERGLQKFISWSHFYIRLSRRKQQALKQQFAPDESSSFF